MRCLNVVMILSLILGLITAHDEKECQELMSSECNIIHVCPVVFVALLRGGGGGEEREKLGESPDHTKKQ